MAPASWPGLVLSPLTAWLGPPWLPCASSSPCFPRRTILEQHERESCYLRDVALATEQNYAKNDHEATLNFQSARDDLKNKARVGGGTSNEPFRACEQNA